MDFNATFEEKQIEEIVKRSILAKQSVIEHNLSDIKQAVTLISDALRNGNKILIAGNGGSAADSQHFAAEFVGRFRKERKGIPCIALTTDTSIITAWSNDYTFDTLFQREVETLGNKGDVFIGISTSGNSANIINALRAANDNGLSTVALLGKNGGKAKGLATVQIIINNDETARIQECHLLILHIIAELLD